jgi:hypothetical protein
MVAMQNSPSGHREEDVHRAKIVIADYRLEAISHLRKQEALDWGFTQHALADYLVTLAKWQHDPTSMSEALSVFVMR